MLEIERFDLDEIAAALSDQNLDDEHQHLIDPETGNMVLWTREGGVDGTNPVDLDELDLPMIRPLPSYLWYQDMADFVDLVSDEQAARATERDPGITYPLCTGFSRDSPVEYWSEDDPQEPEPFDLAETNRHLANLNNSDEGI